TVKAHFLTVDAALPYLEEHAVDLLFLDVEMPGATGFDLLDCLTSQPKVILTTSKTEYAFDAFQYNVDDYLKKPFTYKRFLESVQKVFRLEPVDKAVDAADHIFIKVDTKLIKLLNDDILYIESMGDYVRFVTASKKLISLNTMKNLEEKLNKACFVKVHRSYMVNLSKIDDLQGNTMYIKGNEVPIGKGHRDEVLKRLNII
ncbi:MAG TPA: LytTR family DNA-binding domain-containing protein, partial [Flavisolibacter sp.]|nr:LytTR family DNA-binding domain-containing protein [Flavisolibacter sp.]